MQRTSGSASYLHCHTSLEEVTDETPDISEYLDFAFYDWCWYNENSGLGDTKLGKWLGISHRVGSIMSYWVIKVNGMVVSRTNVSRVPNIEAQTDESKSSITVLDKAIQERFHD